TDGIGVAPDGRLRRVKLLSTGALRGRAAADGAGDRLRVDASWDCDAAPLRGLILRRPGRPRQLGRVASYSADDRTLELQAPLTQPLAAGETFELVSDEDAPLFAARLLMGSAAGEPLPGARIRLATTLGTNALLERHGARTALFITAGFGDLLRIGTQQRPDLFALDIVRPEPFYETVVEVPERIEASGRVLRALSTAEPAEHARRLVRCGLRTAAVALMHAYRNPAHERELARLLTECGFTHVSCSHELAPLIKLVPRAQTAVVDAYLAPVIHGYLTRVGAAAGDGLLVMTSAGGLSAPDRFRPKDSLFSGPAGGVVGAAHAGRRAGYDRLISFDMGGTSTDVARIDDDYEYRYEQRIGDAELIAPGLAIETVAAGGGSVCWLDGARLRVGPESAGAAPGPACYGAGGPLTLTDVNLLLGRLDASRFGIPVDRRAAERRLGQLLAALADHTGEPVDAEAVLRGLIAIADETMADAIRRISLRRGYDPSDYVLVAFGGAGGQHACGVADRLGMTRVVVPPDAALLSAAGLGHAVLERFAERQVLEPLERCRAPLARWIDELAREASRDLLAAGAEPDELAVRRRLLQLRLAGQEATIGIDWQPAGDPAADFERAYVGLYGHAPESRSIELESIRVIVSAAAPPGSASTGDVADGGDAADVARRARYDRGELAVGRSVPGPALIVEPHSTTVVDERWTATVLSDGALGLARATRVEEQEDGEHERPESIRLELFTQRFTNLVREMGERLERTAVSTNVKERLDFSCALLDPHGSLVVNAPHIPVHLGALGLCVRRLGEAIRLRPGDVAVTNHPAFGGSHLPDVTVVTPVFVNESGGRMLGYVASRAHHAEIGGIRPGSMPPAATSLAEEGVVIPPTLLIEQGRPHWERMRRLLLDAEFPTRAVEDNLADLRAAVAANHAGGCALRELARVHGADTVLRFMEQLDRIADDRIRCALRKLGDGVYGARELLDDGSPLVVRAECEDGRITLDFTGSSGVHPGNLNATPAIVRSAVLYVLRLLIDRPLPLNEGLLRAATIRVPSGILDPPFSDDPRSSPAVVGGNVETSQRLVDTLIRALGLAACSQGTMNNVIFGNASFGYYETIGGGCGAGPGFDGASAVHSHMTNTRITDPEVVEHRYPVRLERFAVRPDSGGAGFHRGGDGLVREFLFLDEVELSLLTQHRNQAPYGMQGGQAGRTGAQRVIRANGETLELGAVDGCSIRRGDRLIVETPGGGGWGVPG
ncbi:MAG TPA: hydantoinase B/oxoprolinase family protein, partial [Candidatus Polarisedimenticolaceae bacterium]|nr:hydantoinase B/oxoprolinase family protein [Candidatus Polarisedimenticolaceae bacterium]